jgi:hypothetical protein
MTLEDDVADLRAENAALRAQLAAALVRIAELEQRRGEPPAFVKPKRPTPTADSPRKKRAAEHNRARHREEPTRIVTHALDRCPDCMYRLRGRSIDYIRQVIDLPPPPPVEVVEHQVVKRWCPCCQRWQRPRLDLHTQVLGQGRIGVRLASLLAYLRTTLRLPVRAIQRYLGAIHHFTLSVGGIVGILHQVRRRVRPALDQLQQQARASPILHGDETGWRENGQNGWAWSLSTASPQPIRYFEYNRSRSHVVVKRLLGGQFAGHLVSDFYGAYNTYAGPHQRCWVHLLRDLHALKVDHPHQREVQTWAQAVRKLHAAAHAWLHTNTQPTPSMCQEQYAQLVAQVHVLGLQYAQVAKHPCQAVSKRLLRHEHELFQFLVVDGLHAHNKLAERSIRPLVVMRKISGGSRSADGTQTRMALASLFETWQAQAMNPFQACLAVLTQTASPQT